MYKLVAIDLDGTMLNSYGEVTQKTISTIKNTINKCINVVIASGRTVDSISGIADEIGANNYIIAGNGAIIYDVNKSEIIYEKNLSKLKALNIMKICEEKSINYSVYTDKTIIADALKYNILYYYKENLKKEESKKTKIKIVENIPEYVKNMQNEKVVKICVCDKNELIFKSILKKIKNLNDIEILDVSHMSRKLIRNGTEDVPIEYYYTEISEKDVDKWVAIQYLSKILNINQNEIITFGDNINDLKMIQNAGLGIAMKGCSPRVSNIANYITEFDNNNDGVAKTLEKFC